MIIHVTFVIRRIFVHVKLSSKIWPIVSATLSEVETLKYPSFHGICFFDEIFTSFNLVSDFFSKWNFLKTGFRYLRVFGINIKVLIYLNLWHDYFFNMKIYFDNNFYFNKFIYLFLLQDLNIFVSSNPPSWKDGWFRWVLERLVAASALLFL